jgi:hypothetical protein
MFTLIVKAKGVDGKPLAQGEAVVMNVDNGLKYFGFVGIENGEARISVPKGNYDAIADDFEFEFDDATNKATIRLATVGNYKVTGAGQTMSIDWARPPSSPRSACRSRPPSVRAPSPGIASTPPRPVPSPTCTASTPTRRCTLPPPSRPRSGPRTAS